MNQPTPHAAATDDSGQQHPAHDEVDHERRHRPDTVENAAATPEKEQPYAALGLKPDEYEAIKALLGRRPTSGELAMYSVMWSEHCSYKSSKVHLKQFGQKVSDEMKTHLMVGMGENAGVVDVGEGWAVTFKIESHNHPSYIEPFQGAATGVGGIVRDIISMGARPVAVMDALRFGAIDHADTARVVPGVVSGISHYGNCLGLPNIGGETYFDAVYQANPLVNALAVGVLRHEDLHLANARGVGNKVVLFGARTGGDGIGGASILASDTFSEGGPTKRPAVQVGDPFAEKVLIECCLELYRDGLVEGIQDLGAAGISCATSELASNGDGGMVIDLDKVLLRDPSLTAEEILMSESQERMMAIVEPAKLDAFLAMTAKWDVETSVLGEVTDTGRLIIHWRGETIVDVDPTTVAVDGPVYHRPMVRPAWLDALQADSASTLPRAADDAALQTEVLRVLGSANLADASWITNQYDYYVGGNTALAVPDDGGMIRVDEESGLGVALATDANGRYCQLDPYVGRAAGPRRGVPQRRRDRGEPARRLGLPQLRQPREPRGDVAVRAGRRGSRRRVPRAGHPGHRRQRVVLQPDRRRPHPPDPRRRRDGRHRPRRPASALRLAGRRREPLPAGRHARRARRLGVGRRRARAPRRPPAAGRPRGREEPRRPHGRGRGGGPRHERPRPQRRRAHHDPRRGRAALRRRRPRVDHRALRARRRRCDGRPALASRGPGCSSRWPARTTSSSAACARAATSPCCASASPMPRSTGWRCRTASRSPTSSCGTRTATPCPRTSARSSAASRTRVGAPRGGSG